MLFFFDCPKCLKVVKADSSLGGDMAECPHCESQLLVPMDAVGPGTIVGGFHLVKKLGVGGMGDVYLAEQPSLKRLVALKVLPPAMTRKERFLDRFIHETKMHGSLQHPNIATAYDAGCDRDIYYLAMEYAEGHDLNHALERRKRIGEAEALALCREVALALKYAWDRKKIIHCDIKPGNIILTTEGGVKVLDLGLSKSLVDMADLTQTGYMVGTPLYMSPEQADGSRDMDFRSDLYSLGSTLYHLVTGSPPYSGKTVSEVIAKRATTDARPARELNPDLSPGCENLLRRLLQRKPEQRFASYDDFLAAVERVRRGKKIPAVAGPPPWRRALLIAVGSLLLLASGLILLSGKKPPREDDPGPDPATEGVGEVNDDTALGQAFLAASLRLAEQPGDLDLHLRAFEALRTDARAQGQPDLALRADAQVQALRAKRDQEVNTIVNRLRQEAQALIDRHEYVRAGEVVQNYQGPYRLESEKARAALGQTLRAQAQSARLQAVERFLRELEAKADGLVQSGKTEEALALVEGGEGPLGPHSREERRALSQKFKQRLEAARLAREQAQAQARADSEWTAFLDRLALLLRKPAPIDALALLRGQARTNEVFAPIRSRVDAVEKDLLVLARADFLVLNSFTNDVGREVEVQLVRGPVRARIEGVNPPYVEASRRAEQAVLNYKWSITDLSLAEKWRRAEQSPPTQAPLLCAHLALAAGNEKAASGVLAKHPGEVAAALLRLLVPPSATP